MNIFSGLYIFFSLHYVSSFTILSYYNLTALFIHHYLNLKAGKGPDMDYKKTITEYYTGCDEQNRLIGNHSLERIRTWEIISRYLKKENEAVADIGGGPGIHSFWLAGLGHRVDLLDLVPRHIEQVRETEQKTGIKLNSCQVGNAGNLPFEDSYFDKVLLCGPLYHIQEREERLKVIREALRILKPGGCLFAAAISRFASLADGIRKNLISDPVFRKILEQDLENGFHNNETRDPKYFTTSFFHHPDELEAEIIETGGQKVSLFAVEGVGELFEETEEKLKDPEYRDYMLKLIRKTETDRTILGISLHLIGFAEKAEKNE